MNESEERLIAAIEQEEGWLRDRMARFPEPVPQRLEHLKLRVRIEAEQRAVDANAEPALSAAAIGRIKAAVRAELERPGGVETSRGRVWHASAFWGGLAAVAAVALAVTTFLRNPPAAEASLDPAVADFVAVLTSSTATREELSDIASDVDQLEETFTASQDNWLDSQLDEIEDEIDRLLGDTDSDFTDA